MFSAPQQLLLRFLRVPPEPAATAGGAGARVFRASPRLYTLKLLKWGIGQAVVLLSSLAATLVMRAGPDQGFAGAFIVFAQWLAWIVFAVQLAVTYVLLRIDYEQRWYVVTDRSLRIREGVVRVEEKTMTFANIQHLSVKQGPLQRLLGIADLEVQSAGGGGGATAAKAGQPGMNRHSAFFRGVDNAEEIRSAIRDRVRLHRDAGLGDPDDHHHAATAHPASSPGAAPALLEAARELTVEARALRGAVERTGARVAAG